jgi:hypothetical protein
MRKVSNESMTSTATTSTTDSPQSSPHRYATLITSSELIGQGFETPALFLSAQASLRYSSPGPVFTQIRPLWVGDIGTGQKKLKILIV